MTNKELNEEENMRYNIAVLKAFGATEQQIVYYYNASKKERGSIFNRLLNELKATSARERDCNKPSRSKIIEIKDDKNIIEENEGR